MPAPAIAPAGEATAIALTLGERLGGIDWATLLQIWGIRIGSALLILLLGMWLARQVGKVIERALGRAKVDPMLGAFTRNIIYLGGVIVVGVAALAQLNVPIASLLAVLGAAGLAIGLALKDSLSNFASGFMLILLRPFRSGDFVEIAGLEGRIDQVSVFQTQMQTIDNRMIVLPNSQITSAPIINFTALPQRRVDLAVGVGYNDNIAHAREVLLAVAKASPRVLVEPVADVLVTGLGESSVNLVLRAWVSTPDVLEAKSELLEGMHAALRQHGLSIPFPQRDLHVYHHGKAPPESSPLRDVVDDGDP